MRKFLFFLVFFLSSCGASSVPDRILRIDHTGFTLWIDCKKRGAQFFRYNAQRDTGNFKRHRRFYFDPDVPRECQQWSTKAYHAPKGAPKYDRGHLVPANHLDYDRQAIRESNYITNILPQTATLNRGAWYRTEEIIECRRDRHELQVLGGPVWGNDPSDDYFLKSHGVETPSAFWKVVVDGTSGEVNAWIIPNDRSAKKSRLDSYLVPVATILKVIDEDMDQEAKEDPDTMAILRELMAVQDWPEPEKSWPVPRGCQKE